MDLGRHITSRHLTEIGLVPLINVILLVAALFLTVSLFAVISPLDVALPRALTSDMTREVGMTLVVSSENIIYLNDKVVTQKELKDFLGRAANAPRPLLIKADRRASVGRLVDVWNVARAEGVSRINVAADQEP